MRSDAKLAGALECATALAILLLLSPSATSAQAGYASAPFREAPVALAQGVALERLEVAARALGARPAGDAAAAREEGADKEDGGPLADFALFRASLAELAPELEARLTAALGEMVAAVEDSESAAGSAGEVVDLVGQARGILLAPAVADAPSFRTALMASLLLEEGGVAEGYEGAVEGEADAYAMGWFALQRVKALWGTLSPAATQKQVQNIGLALDMLDDLFPSGAMPERLSPDPEQAEAPAQMLVGLLEVVADADLYPGRDLARATGLVHEIASRGCTTLAAGSEPMGLEELTVAASYYETIVKDTIGVMAPEADASITDGLVAVGEGEASEACAPLLAALAAGKEALTP